GVEVAVIARLVGPAGKFDSRFVGRVAARHPFRFGDAEPVEEGLELRRRSFADPDDADRGGFDQGDASAMVGPVSVEQVGSHPSGRPAAEDDDRTRRRAHREAAAMTISAARGWSAMVMLVVCAPWTVTAIDF